MIEKLLDFLLKIFDKLTDKTVRRKLIIIIACAAFVVFLIMYDNVALCVAFIGFVAFVVDLTYDCVAHFYLKFRFSGKRALCRLGRLDNECKRIVRDIYKSDSQSIRLLMSNGARVVLLDANIIVVCSTMARTDGRDFTLSYALQPWVRRYIDYNSDWLEIVPKGSSKAFKQASEYEL